LRHDVDAMTESDERDRGEVLKSLPAHRPQRRSARRDRAEKAKPPGAGATGGPTAKTKPKPKPRPARERVASTQRPTGVKPSAATDAASSTPSQRPAQPPEGIELVGTAIQAAGELAQLGLTLGTKALRGAVSRLPRP
jgi:hypothetical protein